VVTKLKSEFGQIRTGNILFACHLVS